MIQQARCRESLARPIDLGSGVAFMQIGRPGNSATPGHQETLGEAENLAVQWPEFFTLTTFGRDDPRATDPPYAKLSIRPISGHLVVSQISAWKSTRTPRIFCVKRKTVAIVFDSIG